MIGLATKLAEIGGAFVLPEIGNSDLYKRQRRYQRVQTLDGGVVLEVRGLFDADKSVSLVVEPDESLLSLLPLHTHWTLSTVEGFFMVFLASWDVTSGGLSLTLEGL